MNKDIEQMIQRMNDAEEAQFDDHYLQHKESLPKKLTNRKQTLNNMYFLQQLRSSNHSNDEYRCQQCKKPLFYYQIQDQTCSNEKCQSKIPDSIYNEMKQEIIEYEQMEKSIQQNINKAIDKAIISIDREFPVQIIREIQEFAAMHYVNYHQMSFDMSNYQNDQQTINELLTKNKDLYKFGDCVEIDAYGHHFIGYSNVTDELKIITNPSYEGYDFSSAINLLSVPREISDEMPDVLRFYRLNANNMNLFKTGECNKIRQFPVSIISFSCNHPFIRDLFQLNQHEHFPESFKFYVESKGFRRLDTFHLDLFDGAKLQSIPYPIPNNSLSAIKASALSHAYTVSQTDSCSFFIFIGKSDFKEIKTAADLQEIIDECPRTKNRWTVVEPLNNNLKVWRISAPSIICNDDVHTDLFFNHGGLREYGSYYEIEMEMSLGVMIFYGKTLPLLSTDFGKWMKDIEEHDLIEEIENKCNEHNQIKRFVFPSDQLDKYPLNIAEELEDKHKDDLVVKLQYFESAILHRLTDKFLKY